MEHWNKRLEEYRSYLMLERSFSTNTVEAYLRDVRKLVNYFEDQSMKINPGEVKKNHLEGFVKWVAASGLGANSQTRIISGVRAFYKFLLVENVVESDPTNFIKRPKLERKIPEVLSVQEIQKILEAIDISSAHGLRNRAMLETLYACGLRVSELIDLKISNLFLDVGFIKVIGKNDKERLIPIGDMASNHIQQYLNTVRLSSKKVEERDKNILFLNHRGRKLTRVMVFKIVKETAQKTGIQKNVSPHTFRHSFATHLVEGGADLKAVQDMLGHESITTTEIYTHLDKEYLRDTIINFHPRGKTEEKAAEVE